MKYILNIIHRIRDYNRLKKDYLEILSHTSGGKLNNVNVPVLECVSVIDSYQEAYYTDLLTSDINDIISTDGDTLEIAKFINDQ